MAAHRKWLVMFHSPPSLCATGNFCQNLICCVPCVTLLRLRAFCPCHFIESGRLAGPRRGAQVHLIRCVACLRTSAMICITAQLSLVSKLLRPSTIHSPSCRLLLAIPPFLLQHHLTRQGSPRMATPSQMLTSATLLQSPGS